MSARTQEWLDLQGAHDLIAEEVLELTEGKAPPACLPTWIRFEVHRRFHAVYVESRGGYWTFCGRFVRAEGVLDQHVEPPFKRAKCECCKTRLKLPYLVPEKLMKLRGEATL